MCYFSDSDLGTVHKYWAISLSLHCNCHWSLLPSVYVMGCRNPQNKYGWTLWSSSTQGILYSRKRKTVIKQSFDVYTGKCWQRNVDRPAMAMTGNLWVTLVGLFFCGVRLRGWWRYDWTLDLRLDSPLIHQILWRCLTPRHKHISNAGLFI